ncbi:hypothetical protein BN1080_00827 [Planococcus massiliensis]|uniref:ECF transporter S component n=1 Tax=Planococcus massiliensis TaxID=1499687 RepID=A0A098EJD2_9BACL|nr:ECF transporter S component [Planococcus massiliensis]CEG21907.1 hypothetical protein BN1080_00827 [Planococcus massiliensis]
MKTKTLALTAIFISLSAIGGLLKIPVGIASIALDSMPALIAASFLPAPLAAVVAASGHLLSAMLGGFPLGPFHFLIAFEMFAVVWLFAKMSEYGWNKLRWPAFVIGNGIIAAIPFYFLLSPAFFYTSVPGLFLAAAINAGVAAVVMPFIFRVPEKVV